MIWPNNAVEGTAHPGRIRRPLTANVGTIRMKLQDYRIERTAVRDTYSLDRLVRSIKRDMFILFPVTILLITVGTTTDSQPILTASHISFALIFLVFIARLVHFRFTCGISGCPLCRLPMARETHNRTTYIVCHRCRAIFFAYRPSKDPDRIHDEVDIAQSIQEDNEVPTTASCVRR